MKRASILQPLLRVTEAVLLIAMMGLVGGCQAATEGQSTDSTRAATLARRDKLAPLIANAWSIREKKDWPQVTVAWKVDSYKAAEKAFWGAIKEGHIFAYRDLQLESLLLADPIKVGELWYGYVDGYGFPLSLVIEDGGDVVYHVDAWF